MAKFKYLGLVFISVIFSAVFGKGSLDGGEKGDAGEELLACGQPISVPVDNNFFQSVSKWYYNVENKPVKYDREAVGHQKNDSGTFEDIQSGILSSGSIHVSLTDNKTFLFLTSCVEASKKMSWTVATPSKDKLPKETLNLILNHAASFGLEKEDEVFTEAVIQESLEENNSKFRFFIGSVIASILLWYSWLRLELRGRLKPNPKELMSTIKSVDEIPMYLHFPWIGIPIPFLDGLITFLLVRIYGMHIMEKWLDGWKPIVEGSLGYGRLLVTIDPPLLQKILASTDMKILNKPRSLFDFVFIGPLKQGLIASDVDIWKVHRKILIKVFSYQNLQKFTEVMNKTSKALISSLEELIDKNVADNQEEIVESRPVNRLIYGTAIKMVMAAMIGSSAELEKEAATIYEVFARGKHLLMYRTFHPENQIPLIWWLNPKKKEFDKIWNQCQDTVTKMISICRKEVKKEQEEDAASNKIGQESQRLISAVPEMIRCKASENEMFSEVITFLATGQDTTVITVMFLLQHLAEYPQFQKLAQKEIDNLYNSKMKENSEEADLSMDDLMHKLPYLERCIMETLRLTPAAPVIFREVSQNIRIEPFEFKKGQLLSIPIWGAHRNPDVYPDPHRYDPDRFLPEVVATRHPYTFLPFSHGIRNCIAQKFAMMQIKMICSRLLYHYIIKTKIGLKDMKILYEVNIQTDKEFHLVLSRRQPQFAKTS